MTVDLECRIYPSPLPTWVRRNHRRGAECRVYDALYAQLKEPWGVFYSRPWLGIDKNGLERDGEADFVLVHPDFGMLVLEVKGGKIEYNATSDRWASTDGTGIRRNIQNPALQAVRNKHGLLRILKANSGWDRRHVRARHGVIFPDCVAPAGDLGSDIPRRIVADIDQLTNLGSWAEARLTEGSEDEVRQLDSLGVDGVAFLTSYFARSFTLESPVAASLQYDEDEIRILTDQQSQLLSMLDDVKRLAIPGPAGTGKTALALEKARRLAKSGKRTLLLCYNRPLARQLQLEAEDTALLIIRSFHGLCNEIAARAGISPEDRRRPGRDLYADIFPEVLRDGLKQLPNERFDAVIVDEGQDFSENWLATLESLLLDPSNGTLFIFYDDNQKVHSRETSISRHLPSSGIRLTRILRNAKSIVDGISPLLPKPYDAAGPAGLGIRWNESQGGISDHGVANELNHLINEEHISPDKIAVLFSDDNALQRFVKDSKLGSWPVFDAEGPPRKRLVADTVRRFKGLERPVVIIVEPEELIGSPELLYVALTRARILLVLLASRGRLAQVGILLDRDRSPR